MAVFARRPKKVPVRRGSTVCSQTNTTCNAKWHKVRRPFNFMQLSIVVVPHITQRKLLRNLVLRALFPGLSQGKAPWGRGWLLRRRPGVHGHKGWQRGIPWRVMGAKLSAWCVICYFHNASASSVATCTLHSTQPDFHVIQNLQPIKPHYFLGPPLSLGPRAPDTGKLKNLGNRPTNILKFMLDCEAWGR